MSSEAQTSKGTQRTHEGVVLNEWLFIGKCGRIGSTQELEGKEVRRIDFYRRIFSSVGK